MRILFLSDNFPPESNAPATRTYEHAVRWVEIGHEVTVITCAPNFPEGKLFNGYKNRWYRVEEMDGIRVVRVKTYISANAGFLKRTLDYVSFMVSGFVAGLFQHKPDVIIGTSPQFFCAVCAWAVASLRRKPFVFELRDLWPASIVAVGAMETSLLIRMIEKIELFLYRRARAIIAVTESFKRDLIRRGIDGNKIHVVRNGVDLGRYIPMQCDTELAQKYGLQGKFVAGYLGTHGMAHGLDKVIEAAEILREREDIVFLFVGAGAARGSLEESVVEKRLENVRLMALQPKNLMPRLWSLCDVCLVPLRNNPVFSTVMPSKIFESLAMGVPVILSLPEGEATNVVRELGAGDSVPPENPRALADKIASLRDDPEWLEELRSGCSHARPDFSRIRQADKMVEVLSGVTRKRATAIRGR